MILYLDCASGISGDMCRRAAVAGRGARADPGPGRRAAPGAGGHHPLVQIEDVRRGRWRRSLRSPTSRLRHLDELIVSLYASDLSTRRRRRRLHR
jgi:hypothetical protein